MRIASRDISRAQPPYIIAELGVNHDGSLDRALQLVDAASAAGADAIKLQWFDARMLLSRQAALATYQAGAGEVDALDMLDRLQLSAKDMAALVDHAHQLELHAIVTVFSAELVSDADALPWDAYKIASPDIVNRPLIERIAATGQPMILSTGAASLDEVKDAAQRLGDRAFALLQCVSAYPTPDECASLGGITALAQAFPQVPAGYSDHTTSMMTGAFAVAAGACLLEKHLTYDRNAEGPDHAASLDGAMFQAYVDGARRAYAMLGPAEKRVLDIEREVRSLSRQSVTATRDLLAGHTLAIDDLTVKRPGTGIPAAALTRCIGRTLKRHVAANTQLAEDDLA